MFNQQKEDDKIEYYASELSRQSDKIVLQKSNLVLQKKLKSKSRWQWSVQLSASSSFLVSAATASLALFDACRTE